MKEVKDILIFSYLSFKGIAVFSHSLRSAGWDYWDTERIRHYTAPTKLEDQKEKAGLDLKTSKVGLSPAYHK